VPGPPIIDPVPDPSGSSVASGILRPLYRRALGQRLGPFFYPSTTAVSTHAEARRHIICSLFVDDELDRDAWKGYYAYVASGDAINHQARIVRAGYYGGGGVAEVSRPFASALASGVVIEISSPLPCEEYLGIDGLNQCVNWALEHCDIEYRLSLTGNGTQSYDLTSYANYLDADLRVDSIWDTLNATSASAPYEQSPYPLRIEASGGALTLITGRTYATSETFQLRVIRQGHTLIKSSGVWISSTVGLTDDTQGAAVPIPWVVAFGMVRALQVVADLIERDETLSDAAKARKLAINARERQKWSCTATDLIDTAFPQPSAPITTSMLWTPQVVGTFESLQGSSTSLPISVLP
jgi:hypothetical protein